MNNRAWIIIALQNGIHLFSTGLFHLKHVFNEVNQRIRYYRENQLSIQVLEFCGTRRYNHSYGSRLRLSEA